MMAYVATAETAHKGIRRPKGLGKAFGPLLYAARIVPR